MVCRICRHEGSVGLCHLCDTEKKSMADYRKMQIGPPCNVLDDQKLPCSLHINHEGRCSSEGKGIIEIDGREIPFTEDSFLCEEKSGKWSLSYVCTLPKDHDGDHIAQGVETPIISKWKNKKDTSMTETKPYRYPLWLNVLRFLVGRPWIKFKALPTDTQKLLSPPKKDTTTGGPPPGCGGSSDHLPYRPDRTVRVDIIKPDGDIIYSSETATKAMQPPSDPLALLFQESVSDAEKARIKKEKEEDEYCKTDGFKKDFKEAIAALIRDYRNPINENNTEVYNFYVSSIIAKKVVAWLNKNGVESRIYNSSGIIADHNQFGKLLKKMNKELL
jgi:hypothetical protein